LTQQHSIVRCETYFHLSCHSPNFSFNCVHFSCQPCFPVLSGCMGICSEKRGL
jgi:hypothetical protein